MCRNKKDAKNVLMCYQTRNQIGRLQNWLKNNKTILSLQPRFTSKLHSVYLKLPCTERCKTKHNTLFHQKNYKQTKLQQISINHLSDNDFGEFNSLSRKCTAELYSVLVIDINLLSDN